MTWQSIESAPKDGTVIRYRRMWNDEVRFEGLAVWRTVRFPAYDDEFPAFNATGWMYPDREKRVPEPTHWMPISSPPGDVMEVTS